MDLVEHDDGGVRQLGVTLQPSRQHAFGDHFDPRLGADLPFVAGDVPHSPAHRLAEELGHPSRRRPGGEPTRFEHDDLATVAPGFVEKAERNDGRLAGAGWSGQYRRPGLAQRSPHLRDDLLDG